MVFLGEEIRSIHLLRRQHPIQVLAWENGNHSQVELFRMKGQGQLLMTFVMPDLLTAVTLPEQQVLQISLKEILMVLEQEDEALTILMEIVLMMELVIIMQRHETCPIWVMQLGEGQAIAPTMGTIIFPIIVILARKRTVLFSLFFLVLQGME